MIHFLESQSKIPGYSSPFRLDRDQKGRGIVVFVRGDITANKSLSLEDKPIEAHIELNLLKKKWLFSCSYNPNKKTSQTIYND